MTVSMILWLVVALIMAVVEALTTSLVTVWFVIGAIAAFVGSLCNAPLWLQLVIFLVVSIIALVAFRPLAIKTRTAKKAEEPTIVGTEALVSEPITANGMSGRVRTPDGITWAAKSSNGCAIPLGTPVIVIAQESVWLTVERKPLC